MEEEVQQIEEEFAPRIPRGTQCWWKIMCLQMNRKMNPKIEEEKIEEVKVEDFNQS